jgi:hypothetical protein
MVMWYKILSKILRLDNLFDVVTKVIAEGRIG